MLDIYEWVSSVCLGIIFNFFGRKSREEIVLNFVIFIFRRRKIFWVFRGREEVFFNIKFLEKFFFWGNVMVVFF